MFDRFVATELCDSFGMLLLAHHVDQNYVVDEFAQEVYPQVLSTTTSYQPYLSKPMEMSHFQIPVHGNGPKHFKSLTGSYFQIAPHW